MIRDTRSALTLGLLAGALGCAGEHKDAAATDSAAPVDTGERPGDSADTDSGPDPDSGADSDSAPDTDPPDTADWAGPAGDCALSTDLATPWFLEGDTVRFTVRCTGDLATEDARIQALSLPAGASFDEGARDFQWETGPADGGRISVVFSVTAADGAGVPTAETVTFWVADNPAASDNVAVDPETYTEEWGLPVLHVDAVGTISQEYTRADVTWQGAEYAGQIKIRGASSAYYPKPSYTLEFNDDELPIPAWGKTRNHLVLITTFDDNSYVRQKLVYDTWAAMADYWGVDRLTPRTFFVVVYLEGKYQGLYMAIDRIDDEYMDHMGFDRDANLYKSVNHDANFYLTGSSGGAKSTLHDGYTKEEGADESDFSDLDALVSFTGNATASALIDGADAWIDLEEFMDWFLLVHYTLSEDSAGKNAYLAHTEGGLFRYSPWDFNHSWGQGWYTNRVSSSKMNYFTSTNRVFWALQSVSATNDALWERFAALREDGPFSLAWQEAQIDAYYAEIDPSAARDWDKWGSAYKSYSGWAGTRNAARDWTDYEGEKAYLTAWIEARYELFEEAHP